MARNILRFSGCHLKLLQNTNCSPLIILHFLLICILIPHPNANPMSVISWLYMYNTVFQHPYRKSGFRNGSSQTFVSMSFIFLHTCASCRDTSSTSAAPGHPPHPCRWHSLCQWWQGPGELPENRSVFCTAWHCLDSPPARPWPAVGRCLLSSGRRKPKRRSRGSYQYIKRYSSCNNGWFQLTMGCFKLIRRKGCTLRSRAIVFHLQQNYFGHFLFSQWS